jgi:hypothetical protein
MVCAHIWVYAYPVPNGTVGVVAAIPFYPYFVPNGTDDPNHRQHNFSNGMEQVLTNIIAFPAL